MSPARASRLPLDVGPLLPEPYAAYRPLVAEALLFFLEQLPAPRLLEIAAEQSRLPPPAPLAARAVAVLRRCPTLHKLGQVVARDRRLAPELRRHLQGLESSPPAAPVAELLRAMGGGPPPEWQLDAPLAEGSVAVVVPFTWREGAAPPREGVLKILKPGVEERLQEELEIWPRLGQFLEERSARHGLPVLEYRETLERVRTLLQGEVRLDRERDHLAAAARFYAGSPAVLIPRLLPFSTPRATAMERVRGRKAPEAGGGAAPRRRLAETILAALVAQPFWSAAPTATFHADPHAGNLFCSDDGRLAVLDWSLVARLSKAQRVRLMQILLGALCLDAPRIAEAAAALAAGRTDADAIRTAAAVAVGEVRGGRGPGFAWLLRLLDRLVASGAATFPEDLLFFRKALLSLLGVVADVSADCDLDAVLSRAAGAELCREWPARILAAPDSRAFGTHLSNADLLGLWLSLPATAARFWAGLWRDLGPARG